ncbi:amidohydrolase/hippurate hydrolase [Hydrogenispora ethanolica]|uniref:Amidohydrolase/hippurate hydrolase n=1 Tax=Hydrogenispora ethanolica TaxID=1082276 RepID=A0A4R1QZ80_HYDET|nr:M20 family metallopeptidase [Hydrogenispora ethanolica]TCL58286.1 amidohydrolase/hippurate hydrolase [Hydrogenispora ethanolica]
MDELLLRAIQDKIRSILPEITTLRRQIHQEPEIGLATQATRQKIRAALQETSLVIQPPLLEADLIADLPKPGAKMICLRADTDGLPIQEATGLAYRSRVPGAMHACGHDGHTAILVGTARVLDAFRSELPVAVRFIFQPGEEMICGGKTLVRRGACAGAAAAYALHNWPGLPVGHIAARSGPLFSAGAMFSITLTGRGCHGAMPEQGLNPLPVAAALITRFQELHQRLHPVDGSILSVCSIHGGESKNIIPDSAVIRGTTRFLSTAAGDRIEAEMRRIIAAIATESGTTAEMEYEKEYSLPVLNTETGFERIRATVQRYLAEEAWQPLEKPNMTCEDFAFYLEGREGAMFLLGNGTGSPGLHNAEFDFDDRSLETGILVMSLLALNHS